MFLLPRVKARDIFSHGIVGGFSANYVGPVLSSLLEHLPTPFGGTYPDLCGWVAGVSGMVILHRIITFAETWNLPPKRLKND